jgi:hypothetical protein
VTLKKFEANDIDKTRTLEVELGGKILSIDFARLSVRLVKHVLLVDAKGGGIASAGQMLQLGLRGIVKIDTNASKSRR